MPPGSYSTKTQKAFCLKLLLLYEYQTICFLIGLLDIKTIIKKRT